MVVQECVDSRWKTAPDFQVAASSTCCTDYLQNEHKERLNVRFECIHRFTGLLKFLLKWNFRSQIRDRNNFYFTSPWNITEQDALQMKRWSINMAVWAWLRPHYSTLQPSTFDQISVSVCVCVCEREGEREQEYTLNKFHELPPGSSKLCSRV